MGDSKGNRKKEGGFTAARACGKVKAEEEEEDSPQMTQRTTEVFFEEGKYRSITTEGYIGKDKFKGARLAPAVLRRAHG
jgi:hypothetical protein